jgi:hypothetical protein
MTINNAHEFVTTQDEGVSMTERETEQHTAKPTETPGQPSRKAPKPPKPRKVEKRRRGRKG